MNTNTQRILFWAPRILGIIFALFLSVFALDVFSEGYGIGETLVALLIHLIPTGVVVFALVIAWRWPGVGAIFFIAVAVIFFVTSSGESWIISGPLLLIGLLFLLDWIFRVRPATR